jgi:Putative MetA-pathway of phenol degradation
MRRAALVLGLVLLPLGAGAAEVEPISPDRTSAATGTSTVGAGAVQLESGVAYGRERIAASPTERRFGVELAVRVGLTERLEVGFTGEPVVVRRAGDNVTDHGDFGLTAKYRFLDAAEGSWLPSLAVLPFVTLPVNEPPLGSGKTDVGALLLASFGLPAHFNLDLNGGLVAVGQSRPSGYLLQGVVAGGLSRDLSDRFTLFGDVLYASRDERAGRDRVSLDAGVIVRPTPAVALDASIVTTLAGSGPEWTLRGGVSVRF